MHVDGDPEPGCDLFVVRQESHGGDGVNQDGAEASMEGAVHVAVFRLDLQTDNNLTRTSANELTLDLNG